MLVSKFSKRGTDKGKTVVRGKVVNRGTGYDLEIPGQYDIFYGDTQMFLKNVYDSFKLPSRLDSIKRGTYSCRFCMQ